VDGGVWALRFEKMNPRQKTKGTWLPAKDMRGSALRSERTFAWFDRLTTGRYEKIALDIGMAF
jgi:hypothetical protein